MSKLLLSPEWRELDAKAQIRAEAVKALFVLDEYIRRQTFAIDIERAVIAELVEFLTMNGRRNNADD